MIKETTVFVPRHDEEHILPEAIVRADRVIDTGDEVIAFEDVVRRMLVILAESKIVWLNEDIRRESAMRRHVMEKIVKAAVVASISWLPLIPQQQ